MPVSLIPNYIYEFDITVRNVDAPKTQSQANQSARHLPPPPREAASPHPCILDTQPNSRLYSRSGIYRHVRVAVTNPTHIAQRGVFVTTPDATEASATVAIQTRLSNEADAPANVTIKTTLYDRAGKQAGVTGSPHPLRRRGT